MSESNAIVSSNQMDALRPADVIRQVQLVQEVMAAVMKDGEHYGKIPGCGDKPALLQPGAQVLAFTFRLAPSFDIEVKELPNLHREYVVRCSLASINSGQVVGMGVGSCSTMESKYRYRNVADFEITGEPIPADSKERKAEYRKQGFGMKKADGVWEWVRFKDSAKVENPDIADTYNTVLKMATKRAFVHATINSTACSDMFTQDIEDIPATDTYAAPAPVKLADDTILAEIRKHRKTLDVSDDTYLRQLASVQGAEISLDTELTAKAAAALLSAYEDKLAATAKEAADKRDSEAVQEFGATEVQF